ncbi:MAG: hypothetical protein ACRDFA_00510 [bacterium]
MKRTFSFLLALSALVTVLATAAFAADVDLADIRRPVDASTLYLP